jgi:GT2 family glycosyltransferase
MSLSLVIRSRDEADRLRLVLASLARQSGLTEVVVVDDGSIDHTQAVLREAERTLPLVALRHATARGRSAASNAGATAATGDILLFLDGDTLAGPALVERHLAAHAEPGVIGRGEVFHLRCTRFLQDPETASPRAGEERRLAGLPAAEVESLRVTRRQVTEDFASIERRAAPAIYPGAGPRLLNAMEVEALRAAPDLGVLWAAACGANMSVARRAFLDVGGFDERLDINEHRELALRLYDAGLRLRLVEGAASFHLTHRAGWRDPLSEVEWEAIFWRKHPVAAVKLLAVFWAGLAPGAALPAEARIGSLSALDAAARGESGVDYDAVRQTLGLQTLRAPERTPAAVRP